MEIIKTDTISGAVSVPVYKYTEIPFTDIMLRAPESKKRRGHSYLEIPCAFDIETTNMFRRDASGKLDTETFTPYAFMYHWQLCVGYHVAFGRTWGEFQKCLQAIERDMNLSKNLRLVIYVHNLSFEMQFMRRFLNVTDSFCKSERNPLKITHNECIEFRCSAALSNMSLQMFCKSENARFYKLVDEFDYSKIRTSETVLTEAEQGYCYNDVRGLCECIQSLMRFDTLATIPLTNTGYVRRDSRNEMRQNKKNRRMFKDSELSADEYRHMRQAFRGGDTHASARHANQTLTKVASLDISSSYPACMMMSKKFPISKFIPVSLNTFKKARQEAGRYCFVLHVALENLECIAPHGMPYIAYAKVAYASTDRVLDNGRIMKASRVSLWCTDTDMDIITTEYKCDIRIETVYLSFAGALPDEFKRVIMDYYTKKTTLKGLNDDESLYMYGKSKNRLNSLYGMMGMRIDQSETVYTGAGATGYETTEPDLEAILKKYYKSRNNFLPYQWALTVTSEARARLHRMMNIIGRDLVYVDTDSVKLLHYEKHKKKIDELNEALKAEAEAFGAYADDRNGKRHYMGVWEYEDMYDEFRTLGAKKYVVSINGKCYSTIAGVSKKAGQAHFEKHGINAFRIGEAIQKSGHLIAFYNDDDIHEIEVDGVKMITASNVALIDDTYTIGVTDDYAAILHEFAHG